MNNPLLDYTDLPPFSAIRPEHVEPAVDQALADFRATLQEVVERPDGAFTWDNLARPLEAREDRLERVWAPVRHLNAVMNSEALRGAYEACLPKLSEFHTELNQNQALYRAWKTLADSAEYAHLDPAQQQAIRYALRDFHLAGVDLPADGKARFGEVARELSQLSNQFSNHVLDATRAWEKAIDDPKALAGLPDSAIALARQTAEQRGREGWLLTLDFPSYQPVMSYAEDRELRREMYIAFMTRASDQGPFAGRWDNGPVMEHILALRHEKAALLGMGNYVELSLATKMAESPEQVSAFLEDLASRSLPMAEQERDELFRFAREQGGPDSLEAWDLAYWAERLRRERFQLSAEDLRPWFPAPRVIQGLFDIVQQLFDVRIEAMEGVETWHPDVQFFAIHDQDGELRGRFYLDLYARPDKRGGAWMDSLVPRWAYDGQLQTPVAWLSCNFSPPIGDSPALLTHQEVITLFHEFGHGLHHLLTRVDYPEVAGINGVAWDAVELPSQFMENWCWQRPSLDRIAAHHQSGEPLPEALFQRMTRARNFQAGAMMMRQLIFSLFDFHIHRDYDPAQGARIYPILRQIEGRLAVIPPPDFTRFANAFAHIFGGGYAAGYYSYKWAEVLSADAFAAFEEVGLFDPDTGHRYLHEILEVGGSRDPMNAFIAFRGRKPSIDALLRHSGLSRPEAA